MSNNKHLSIETVMREIVPGLTQIEYKAKDIEHYVGPVRNAREEGEFFIVDLVWRADYDYNDDKWHGSRGEVPPPFKTRGRLCHFVRDGDKIVSTSSDGDVQLIFHHPESPVVKQGDVEGLEILNPTVAHCGE